MRKPIYNTVFQILGKAGTVLISLITTSVLTRKLGVSNYGNFILISSLFVFLDSLADFGTKTIGVREIAREDGEKSAEQILNLRLIMTTISFGLGVWFIFNWKGVESIRTEALVALMMVFLTSIAGFLEMLFQAKMRMDLKVVMDLCFPLTFLIWLWWWRGSVSLLLVMLIYLIARGVSIGIGLFLVSGLSQIRISRIKSEEIKNLWQMTWPMGIFLMMFATYDRAIDSLLIQNFLGSKQVAWYGLAYKIYGVLLQPAYYYVNSIFPIMGAKNTDKQKLFKTSLGIMLVGAILIIIGVYLTAPIMVQILGGKSFLPSVPVLKVLITAALFSYVGHLVGFSLISEGGQKELLKLGAIALFFNLILNILLIPLFGIMAAAWVTVITEALDCGMMGWYLWRRIK